MADTRISGSVDTQNGQCERDIQRLSNAAHLSFSTWNCGGLSKIKKDLTCELDYDFVCFTETHSWRDSDSLTIYSEPPPKNDSWSGVAICINKHLSKFIMKTGNMGSRIAYCRLRGSTCNIFIVGVYIPQQKRTNPDQTTTYGELKSLLHNISRRDCIILLGDFNSRLARNEEGYVGRWCIHDKRDKGGDILMDIMRTFSLKCVSTYFQPRRKHNNATYMNIEPNKPPSQIDYIIISSRWASGTQNCKTLWGPSIKSYGRKYGHASVKGTFRIRLKCSRTRKRKDFCALKTSDKVIQHNNFLQKELDKSERPSSAKQQWQRLKSSLVAAQEVLPCKKSPSQKKWETSDHTRLQIAEREHKWTNLSMDEQKVLNKQIGRSARNDYRSYIENLITDMENANAVGNTAEVHRIAKQLSTKQNGNKFNQPSKDKNGNQITSTSQQLEAWADFIEQKFAARDNEPVVNLNSPNDEVVENVTLEEIKTAVQQLKYNKAPGTDEIPVEQYKVSDIACEELLYLINLIWMEEELPEDFALGEMMLFYKKKCKDDRRNYRALGLLNHAYKVFTTILLMRILPYVEPKLSDLQAGFRQKRGCRDNILILVMSINHLLRNAEEDIRSLGVITYIDFTAAFDSILHSYLLTTLKDYGVPLKYCRLVEAIYKTTSVRIRIQEVGGNRQYSRKIPVRRGVIQGDIPSPLLFIAALDKMLKEHGGLDKGIAITDTLRLAELEFADDAALPDTDTTTASMRLTSFDQHAKEQAGMEISIPKTKVQHVMKRPIVSETTEKDIADLPHEMQFKFKCEKCGMSYPTKHGLSIHKARWCKRKHNAKKPSRKGTVADKIIKRMKIENKQDELPKVHIGSNELENVCTAIYLGAEISGDGDSEITAQHRCNIAVGKFNEYRSILTSTKLPIKMRVRLYSMLVITTMIYGSSAWILTAGVKRKVNGVNSKLLAQVTKRSIHEEAKFPSVDIVRQIVDRRWNYLGHILRLDKEKALRRYLLELSPNDAPFIPGSLLDVPEFKNTDEMIVAANDRLEWKSMRGKKLN